MSDERAGEPPVLQLSDIRAARGHRRVLHGVDLAVRSGELVTLLGPNGCGKSTLVQVAAGLLPVESGQVRLLSEDVRVLTRRESARRVAYLPQHPSADPATTVADLARLGRYAHVGSLGRVSQRDRDAIADALQVTGMAGLAGRRLGELSGGERQRAWLAVVVAQEAPVLLLDEPTTFLDVAHQLQLLEVVDRLRRQLGRAVVMVLHDLDTAVRAADRLVVLHQGRVLIDAPPRQVLASTHLETAFGVRVRAVEDPVTGRPLVRAHLA